MLYSLSLVAALAAAAYAAPGATVETDVGIEAPGDVVAAAVPGRDGLTGAAQVPLLVFDRAAPNQPVWRVSDYVATAESPAPGNARPVYLQFGFMSCPPCHEMAAHATEAMSGRIELVYVHLDAIEAAESGDMREVWERLTVFLDERSEYAAFTGLRRGNVPLMERLTGRSAAPAAMLIAPDGTWQVLTLPWEGETEAAVQAFLAEYAP